MQWMSNVSMTIVDQTMEGVSF